MKNLIKVKNREHLKKLVYEEVEKNGNECDLNHLDISEVDDLSSIFFQTKFNGNISKWNTSNVKSMNFIFCNSTFNGDISSWDVSNVEHMKSMFNLSLFNQDITKWNVSNVKNMQYLFFESQFNQDISNWDIRNVDNMTYIYFNSKSTNIPYWAKIEKKEDRIRAYYKNQYNKINFYLNNSESFKNKLIKV